jgi:hypothetical protein
MRWMRSLAAVTATVAIALGVLLGAGLVVSQLLRLRTYLRNAPPVEPSDGKDTDDSDDQ